MTATPHTQTSAPPASRTGEAVPVVVLDTNVVLDWLVFQDRSCRALAERLESRCWAWHATESMRAELASVLSRAPLCDRYPDCLRTLSVLDRLACLSAPAPINAASAMPRCRDPDDQQFLDLACALGARWLFSRDKALLDLAKPARAFGVEILSPEQWLHRHPQPGSQAGTLALP